METMRDVLQMGVRGNVLQKKHMILYAQRTVSMY